MAVLLFWIGIKVDKADEIALQTMEALKGNFASLFNDGGVSQPQPVLLNAAPAVNGNEPTRSQEKPASPKQIDWARNIIKDHQLSESDICSQFHCNSIDDLSYSACDSLIKKYNNKH